MRVCFAAVCNCTHAALFGVTALYLRDQFMAAQLSCASAAKARYWVVHAIAGQSP